MQLSEHFSLAELTRSETALRFGMFNRPNTDEIEELRRLCVELLEPVRDLLACPLHVNSGYRSEAINRLVGGAPLSAHIQGRAADVFPIGRSVEQAFDWIRASDLPFDQAIFECGAWLHLAIAPRGTAPRRQALTATGGPGRWSYQLVTS